MRDEIQSGQDVVTFATIARNFCSWAEGEPSDGHEEMLTARTLLAELHVAVLRLPDLDCGEDIEDDSPSYEKWRSVFQRFSSLPIASYWDVFAPLNEEDIKPVLNSIADDLSDIYRDLSSGLILFDGGHIAEAVWDWRFNFATHWGAHLTGAQRAIHNYFWNEV